MNIIDILNYVNIGIVAFFMICYTYQFFYIFVAFVKKPKKYESDKMHRFAVMIAARNEAGVVGNLIDSIKAQNYPSDLVDVYVVADNCTDNTVEVVKNAGAIVYERNNQKKIGKGFAMKFLFGKVMALRGEDYYDGYFIFDADNLLDADFIAEMNKAFATNQVLTCYRNSKNYGTNWISAGYALWFLREAKYLNNPRSILGTSCAVSGTGFLIHKDIIKRNGGWNHFLLTEDIEFTIDTIIHEEKIGYCHRAVLYDEQPITFKQSWTQRLRWAKGYLQVFKYYGKELVKGVFTTKNWFSFFDMTMNIAPAVIVSALGIIINLALIILSLFSGNFSIWVLINGLLSLASNAYSMMFFIGLVTTVTEWKKIRCSNFKKILYVFTFPLFMLTYIPIAFTAFFKKVEWKPIEHSVDLSIDDLN